MFNTPLVLLLAGKSHQAVKGQPSTYSLRNTNPGKS